jgi:hypothetical protein
MSLVPYETETPGMFLSLIKKKGECSYHQWSVD